MGTSAIKLVLILRVIKTHCKVFFTKVCECVKFDDKIQGGIVVLDLEKGLEAG